jgi:hypothetical protein
MFAWWIGMMLNASAEVPKKDPRLTWAPYAFLEKGLRTAPWVKDPFFPQMNGLKLSGLISGEAAFINGKWFKRGEEIEGYRVGEISSTSVTLSRRSEVVVLKMEE